MTKRSYLRCVACLCSNRKYKRLFFLYILLLQGVIIEWRRGWDSNFLYIYLIIFDIFILINVNGTHKGTQVV